MPAESNPYVTPAPAGPSSSAKYMGFVEDLEKMAERVSLLKKDSLKGEKRSRPSGGISINEDPSQKRIKSGISEEDATLQQALERSLLDQRYTPARDVSGSSAGQPLDASLATNPMPPIPEVGTSGAALSPLRFGPSSDPNSRMIAEICKQMASKLTANSADLSSGLPSAVIDLSLSQCVKFARDVALLRTTNFQGQKHSTIDRTDPEKSTSSLPPEPNTQNGSQKGYKSVKESKRKKEKTLGDSTNVVNNGNLLENGSNKKVRECSMEDSNSFYSKYDKEVPELRDPIKDYAQFTDYKQEFQEKYDCYVSLNKNWEKIKNDFLKLGEEFELAKGGSSEEYYKVVRRLREMHSQHGERHNQMKRVFDVLHKELLSLKQRMQDFADTWTQGNKHQSL